jgi:hypothetical protein
VELFRYRGDSHQANLLERWLERLIEQYSEEGAAVYPVRSVPGSRNSSARIVN